MKVIRVTIYEGPAEWLEKQISRSLPDGKGPPWRGNTKGLPPTIPGSITVITVVDERPSQSVTDPIVLQAIEKARTS